MFSREIGIKVGGAFAGALIAGGAGYAVGHLVKSCMQKVRQCGITILTSKNSQDLVQNTLTLSTGLFGAFVGYKVGQMAGIRGRIDFPMVKAAMTITAHSFYNLSAHCIEQIQARFHS
jgi:hypothetical protein